MFSAADAFGGHDADRNGKQDVREHGKRQTLCRDRAKGRRKRHGVLDDHKMIQIDAVFVVRNGEHRLCRKCLPLYRERCRKEHGKSQDQRQRAVPEVPGL